jgi:phosphoribosylaminoimidazole-succinocarboxamide synthase
MIKEELLYEGKAKRVFSVKEDADSVWVEFKNSLTAFNGEKKSELAEKGKLNSKITALIFNYLKNNGINTHFIKSLSDTELLCQKVTIIPIEVVVRNVLAGSTAKKFNIPEGAALDSPLVEFYYKNDSLGDPFISDDQAMMLKVVKTKNELEKLKSESLKINLLLKKMFESVNIKLVDFKLEFGTTKDGIIILADEITPDTCRLWDASTNEKLDKDRFRRDLGGVVESYNEVYLRIQKWSKKI